MIDVNRLTTQTQQILVNAQNLLRRFFLETTGQGQRLRREVA